MIAIGIELLQIRLGFRIRIKLFRIRIRVLWCTTGKCKQSRHPFGAQRDNVFVSRATTTTTTVPTRNGRNVCIFLQCPSLSPP